MIKKLISSIIIGALLGVISTTSYFYFRNPAQNPFSSKENIILETEKITEEEKPIIEEEKIENEQENISKNSTIFLDILSPENESIVDKEKINVSGKTISKSIVIINTVNSTFHTTANDLGEFDIDINLESGINILHFTTISPDDSQLEKEVLVTYSTAKI